ncbi:MAG: hypothetical protein VW875_01605 [Planctomycetaceae bacterium]
MSEFEAKQLDCELGEADPSDHANQQLVAYLDGELDETVSQEIERRLADDPEYRLRLQQLQQTWDLLDELPRVNRDESFTQSTVEFVALTAQQDLEETQQWSRLGDSKAIWGRAVITILALVLGIFAGDWYFGQKHRQLLEDLEVISEFDQYRLTEDLQFLKDLEKSGVFNTEELVGEN